MGGACLPSHSISLNPSSASSGTVHGVARSPGRRRLRVPVKAPAVAGSSATEKSMPYAPGSPHRRDRAGVIRVQRGSCFCSWRLRAWRAFFPALCRNVAGGISCGEPGAMAAAGAGGRLGCVVGLANGMDEQAAGRSTSEASGDDGGVERGLLTGSSTNPLGGGQTSAPSPSPMPSAARRSSATAAGCRSLSKRTSTGSARKASVSGDGGRLPMPSAACQGSYGENTRPLRL